MVQVQMLVQAVRLVNLWICMVVMLVCSQDIPEGLWHIVTFHLSLKVL